MHPSTSYLIYATSRSGSTLLCEALMATGVAGYPDEYFCLTPSPLRPPIWLERFGRLPLPVYLHEIVTENSTENGVFGAKVDWSAHETLISHMRQFPEYRDMAAHEILTTCFPNLRYVWITRRNKLRQAISAWKAVQENAWNSLHPPQQRSKTPAKFSYALIHEELQIILDNEANVAKYFTENQIVPFTVVYEDLVQDYEGSTRRLLEGIGIPVPERFSLAPPRLYRQSNTLNDEWEQRYRKRRLIHHRYNRVLGLPKILQNSVVVEWYLLPPFRQLRSSSQRRLHRVLRWIWRSRIRW